MYVDLYTRKRWEEGRGSTLMPEGLLPLRPPTWPPEMIGGDSDLYPGLPRPIFPLRPSLGGAPMPRPLLPLPHPGLVPESLLRPTRPLLFPETGNHAPPLLPLPEVTPMLPHLHNPLLLPPHHRTFGRPSLLPQAHRGRSLIRQPLLPPSLHGPGARLL